MREVNKKPIRFRKFTWGLTSGKPPSLIRGALPRLRDLLKNGKVKLKVN